jgi:hypothetical protein
VDYDRQVQPGSHFELIDEELDLAAPVAVFMEIVQADLAQGDNPGQLDRFFDRGLPVPAGIGHFGGRNAYRMEDMLRRLQIFVYLLEVDEAVADAYDPPHPGLLRLLANKELFDRVIVYKPDVGMSVKIPHLSSV